MKKLAVLLIAVSGLLTGCVVYDNPHRDGPPRNSHDGGPPRGNHDNDRDGVRDNQDRRPNDPSRY